MVAVHELLSSYDRQSTNEQSLKRKRNAPINRKEIRGSASGSEQGFAEHF